MGKPTDTTLTGWIDWTFQPPIFPSNRTPKYAIINISGLQPNPDYEGIQYPTAYNGNSFPIRIDCTGWKKDRPFMKMNWSVVPDQSYYRYEAVDLATYPLPAFLSEDTDRPIFGGENQITREMLYPYYGGQFSVAWIPCLGPQSIWSQMRALGFYPDGGTKLEMISQPGNLCINRYARKSDHSCVKVLTDKTYGIWWPWMYWSWSAGDNELHILLYFQTPMKQIIIPSPADFLLQDIERSLVPVFSVEWDDDTILHLKAYPIVTPTGLSSLAYVPGINPLTTTTDFLIPAWNQMYFPA